MFLHYPVEIGYTYQKFIAPYVSVYDIQVTRMEKRISLVTVGGTFDVLHKGHWFLLEEAYRIGEKILIGLTTDDFVRKMRKSHTVDCYDKRMSELTRFITERKLGERTLVVPISDKFGPTIGERPHSNDIEGILVSEETEPGAEEINLIRVQEGKRPLLIIVVKMVLADDGKPISSTRIRKQEVDRFGKLIG